MSTASLRSDAVGHPHRPGRRQRAAVAARAAALTLPLGLVAHACALPGEPIPVGNPGFEAPAYGLCSFAGADAWVESGDGGAWRPGAAGECFYDGYPGGIPEGVQVGFINFGTSFLGQVLSAVLEPDTTYALTVSVGRRIDCCQMSSYSVRLLAGGVLLVEDPGTLDPLPGTFETTTICFTTGATHPAMGQPLEIRLGVDGGVQANFDDVRLEKLDPSERCESVQTLPGDLDGDGDVDGADLGALLGAWGPCTDCGDCPADLDGSCAVDGGDLGILLGNWG